MNINTSEEKIKNEKITNQEPTSIGENVSTEVNNDCEPNNWGAFALDVQNISSIVPFADEIHEIPNVQTAEIGGSLSDGNWERYQSRGSMDKDRNESYKYSDRERNYDEHAEENEYGQRKRRAYDDGGRSVIYDNCGGRKYDRYSDTRNEMTSVLDVRPFYSICDSSF